MDWPEHSGQVHLISLIHCSWRASMPKKPSLPWVNLLPQSNDEDDATSRVASEQFQNCSSLAYVVLTKMHCVLRWVSSTCSPQSTAPNCELLQPYLFTRNVAKLFHLQKVNIYDAQCNKICIDVYPLIVSNQSRSLRVKRTAKIFKEIKY